MRRMPAVAAPARVPQAASARRRARAPASDSRPSRSPPPRGSPTPLATSHLVRRLGVHVDRRGWDGQALSAPQRAPRASPPWSTSCCRDLRPRHGWRTSCCSLACTPRRAPLRLRPAPRERRARAVAAGLSLSAPPPRCSPGSPRRQPDGRERRARGAAVPGAARPPWRPRRAAARPLARPSSSGAVVLGASSRSPRQRPPASLVGRGGADRPYLLWRLSVGGDPGARRSPWSALRRARARALHRRPARAPPRGASRRSGRALLARRVLSPLPAHRGCGRRWRWPSGTGC